jgi:hypothetical protein
MNETTNYVTQGMLANRDSSVNVIANVIILVAFLLLAGAGPGLRLGLGLGLRGWGWGAVVLGVVDDCTLAAGRDANVIDAVLLAPLVESPAHGVHVRVLLHAAAEVAVAGVDELTVFVLDLRVAQSLVERLREVGVVVELEHQPLRIDAHRALRQLAHRWAAVKARVRVEQPVVAQVGLRPG